MWTTCYGGRGCGDYLPRREGHEAHRAVFAERVDLDLLGPDQESPPLRVIPSDLASVQRIVEDGAPRGCHGEGAARLQVVIKLMNPRRQRGKEARRAGY